MSPMKVGASWVIFSISRLAMALPETSATVMPMPIEKTSGPRTSRWPCGVWVAA